ncbi:MAG: helix-turn-helix domain-containing protein [Candidatus Gastranaerophilales bacterium]|nr:helix-turn-helix domain-containing protein [Candidatus Gastranaerophilales bacterium]
MAKYKNSVSHDEVIMEFLSTPEIIKEYLNASLELFLEDGDFNGFFRSLEYVIKAQDSVSNFAKRTKMSRAALYDIFKSRKEPKIQTVAKILNELGYKIQVA